MLAPIDVGLVTSGVVLKAFGGLALGLALLIWPDRNELVLARLIGLGLVWFAVTGFRAMKQRDGFTFSSLIVPVAALAAGVVLTVAPSRSTDFVGRVAGALWLLYVARTVYDQWRSDERDWSGLPVLSVRTVHKMRYTRPRIGVYLPWSTPTSEFRAPTRWVRREWSDSCRIIAALRFTPKSPLAGRPHLTLVTAELAED